MKIVFIGCVKSSEVFLKAALKAKAEIVGVITMKESSYNADFVDLKGVCEQFRLDCFYTQDINEKGTVEYIRGKKPDVIFCFGWSRLIKKEVLDIAPKGTIGYHPADLPHNRGRHPIIWALALGLDETASCFFRMNETADSGEILSKVKVPILYEDDAASIYEKLLETGCKQVPEIINGLENNTICATKQISEEANEWRKRGQKDGLIDWRMHCNTIYNLVRALSHPYVGAHFEYDGQAYKVWKVKEIRTEKYRNLEFGRVIKVKNDHCFQVKVEGGLVEVLECDAVKLKEGVCL